MAILRSTTIIGSLTLSGPLSANEKAKATDSNFGLVKLGYAANGQNVPLKLSNDGLAYVTVPTTDLSGYLPLTGGTISGNLTVNGTSAFNNSAVFQNTAFTSGAENQVVKYRFKTASNQYGAIYFGKEGPNNGSMIRLDQVEGTARLYFRASSTPGAIVWNQPESNSQLFFDVNTVSFRTAGYLADAGSFRPSSNGTKDLGASAYKFRNVYANAFYENGTALSSKYAAVSHTHTIAQVSNLQSTLDSKANDNVTVKMYSIADGADANNYTTGGMYRFNSSPVNIPSGAGSHGQLLVVRGAADTVAQVAFPYGKTEMYVRTGNPLSSNGAWKEWKSVSFTDHTHSISQISNLQSTLDGKLNTSSLGESTFKVTRGASVSTNTTGYWAAMCNSDNNGAILPTEHAWWHVLSMDWTGSDNTHWVSQLALPTENGDSVYYRKNVSGQSIDKSSWVKLANSSDLGNYLPIQDPSFNGTIYGPKWSGQTGSSADNHAIAIGANAKDYCDFYEYGAVWNFYKSIEGTKTLVAKIQEDGIYHNNTKLSKEGHTHTSSSITDLDSLLSQKANTNHTHTSFGDITVSNITVTTNLTANMVSVNNGFSCNGGFNQYANAYFRNDVSFDKSSSAYISGDINNKALFTRGTLSNANMNPTDTETQFSSIWGLISPGVTTYEQITILRMRRKISGGDNVETSISFGYTFRNPPLVIVQEGGLSNASWTQYKGNTVVKSVSTTGAVIVSGKSERPPMTFLIIGQRLGSW